MHFSRNQAPFFDARKGFLGCRIAVFDSESSTKEAFYHKKKVPLSADFRPLSEVLFAVKIRDPTPL